MTNYEQHAQQEFRAAGWVDENGKFKDEIQEMLCNHVMKLLDLFANEGHSGSTAPYAVNLFSKLAKFEPLVPLTDEDWEWSNVSDYSGREVWQNKRCSHVFKQPDRFDGQPYDIDAVVFWEWCRDADGEPFKSFYTGSDSFRPITFPYTPTKVYQFVPTEEFPNEELSK